MSQVNGQSYSPQSAQEGVTAEAKKEGFRISAMTLPFSAAATYFAAIRKSGPLHKFTNVSSRTALVIMPPFFAFALASEMSIVHQKVSEEASDEHTRFKPANSLNPPHSASLRFASLRFTEGQHGLHHEIPGAQNHSRTVRSEPHPHHYWQQVH